MVEEAGWYLPLTEIWEQNVGECPHLKLLRAAMLGRIQLAQGWSYCCHSPVLKLGYSLPGTKFPWANKMELYLTLGVQKTAKGQKSPHPLCSRKWLSAENHQPYVTGLDRAQDDLFEDL